MSTIELQEIKQNTEKILMILTQNPNLNNGMDGVVEALEKCQKIFGNITIEQAILELDIIKRM